jgi:hypothetical protein
MLCLAAWALAWKPLYGTTRHIPWEIMLCWAAWAIAWTSLYGTTRRIP